jgi:enolase-phosphatase E1
VYEDVPAALEYWKHHQIPVYVYSSGSVAAQKLLFGYSVYGDMLQVRQSRSNATIDGVGRCLIRAIQYFKGNFDTNVGAKTNAESYTKIADVLCLPAEDILFISDNIHGKKE